MAEEHRGTQWVDVAIVYAQAEVDACLGLLRENAIPYQVTTPGDTEPKAFATSMTPWRIGVPLERLESATRLVGGGRTAALETPSELAGYESTRDWTDHSPSREQLLEFRSELSLLRWALFATWAAGVPLMFLVIWIWGLFVVPAFAVFGIVYAVLAHKVLSLRCPRCEKHFLRVRLGFGLGGTNFFANECLNCHLALSEISPTNDEL